MEYITDTKDFQIPGKTAVTLGKFDGLHRGHQKLFEKVVAAKQQGLKAVVFTFDMSPVQVLTGKPQKAVNTRAERYRFLEKMGIDYLIEYPFTKEVSHMDPEDFVKKILVDSLHAAYIAVGTDWRFGYKRQGSGELLEKLSLKYNYVYDGVEKEREDNRIISSTYVREELSAGRIEMANKLLGFPFSVRGEVIHGNQIGRTVGLPTINIVPEADKLLPPNGVYFSKTKVNGGIYDGITNIGKKPTVSSDSQIVVETYLFDFNGDLYGQEAEVYLLEFKRLERRFDSLDSLKQQIQEDVEAGQEYMLNNGNNIGI